MGAQTITLTYNLLGDSGGPLTVERRTVAGDIGPIRRELVGVISATGARDCSVNVPDKFTAVAKYLDWIKKGSRGKKPRWTWRPFMSIWVKEPKDDDFSRRG